MLFDWLKLQGDIKSETSAGHLFRELQYQDNRHNLPAYERTPEL